jgi:hypothetical protein
VGGFNLTLNNSPTAAEHCRIIRPRRQVVIPHFTAPGGGGNVRKGSLALLGVGR